GDDPDVLEMLAGPVEETLSKISGVVDVVGMQRGNPEVTWQIDPAAAGRYGLTVHDVSEQLAAAWLGDVATDLRLLDRRIPVRVRLPDAVRFDSLQLPSTLTRSGDGALIPLASVASMERANGQSELR